MPTWRRKSTRTTDSTLMTSAPNSASSEAASGTTISAEEHARARIEAARFHDVEAARHIESLDRDTRLVFHCHHGGRSQRAAEHYAALGFLNVWNLEGGIDAWSREIDPAVPRY